MTYQMPFNYTVATASGTQQIKATGSTAGVLHGVAISGSASCTVVVHDGTSTAGRLMFGVRAGANVLSQNVMNLNLPYQDGLWISSAGGVEWITIIWR